MHLDFVDNIFILNAKNTIEMSYILKVILF